MYWINGGQCHIHYHNETPSIQSSRSIILGILLNRPLQMLVLNAGVFSMPYTVTEDGYEATFQINHLGQMYLAKLLIPLLVKSAPSRIVTVSAESHR